ncbi:MAG: hypothetical protein K2R98_25830 [Gemmataceae bacterium]|nr:hypothetical protein [Gemmataceae bacterium]
MTTWRSLGVLTVVLVAATSAPAQTYSLTEAPQIGDCSRLQLKLTLSGEMRIMREDKTVPLPLRAAAVHDFSERVLLVGANGLPTRNARHYDTAKIEITAGTERSERSLRPECRLIVAQRPKEQLLSFCPSSPLTRQELELIGEHLDPLAITGLLPGKAVAVGETWKLTNPVAQALCAFEGLIGQELTCKLEGVSGDEARITVAGTANGIDLGAMVKLTVQAVCKYDLKAKRITALEWKQKDEREQGPATPASTVEGTCVLTRSALDEAPKELSDSALIDVPEQVDVPTVYTQVSYRDAKERFELVHAREWQITSQTDDHVILRLMDRGDFVAQVTVTPLTKAETGKHMSVNEFKQMVEDTPGWEGEQVREDGEVKSDNGNWVYRISAVGELEGVKMLQTYYLVAGPNGQQVVLLFQMRPALAEKLGTRDTAMVSGVGFKK